MVSLSGEDLLTFEIIVEGLKERRIMIPDAEVLRMTMRAYHEDKMLIPYKDQGEAIIKSIKFLEESISELKKLDLKDSPVLRKRLDLILNEFSTSLKETKKTHIEVDEATHAINDLYRKNKDFDNKINILTAALERLKSEKKK